MKLPKMTIEARDSQTAHNVPAPNLEDKNLSEQLQEAIQLNQDATQEGWRETTLEILKKYIPFSVSNEEIKKAVFDVTGHKGWNEVSKFVVDDECLEFFNMALKYCKKQGQKHTRNKDFIDGSGIGYVKTYTSRLKKTLEQAFDAKYFYKTPRPLVYALENFNGLDLSKVANAIHPGHWAYPAGHGTKFLTAVEVLRNVFHLDNDCSRAIFIAAAVEAMGRSGSLIHYPQDNLAGGYLTTLKEFN